MGAFFEAPDPHLAAQPPGKEAVAKPRPSEKVTEAPGRNAERSERN